MKTKLISILITVCLLSGLTACDRASETPRPAYTPAFEKSSCPFAPPPGQVAGKTMECGYLLVPEDRAHPESRTIRLAVAIFHPPEGTIEPDPIIYLVGGPGASALELIYLTYQGYAPILAANRDLIIFDQRGVGFSDPALDCKDAHELGLQLLDNEIDGRQLTDDEMEALFDGAYRACAQELAQVADLTAYNTVTNAADVNDLRIALGYEQVNLWGGSYGTRLALGVMRDYPEGIRSVVLDSVYPPDVDMYLETPANLDRSLTLLFDTCASDPACNSTYPNLRQVFFDTTNSLDENPARLGITNPLTGKNYDLLLTGSELFGLVFQLLYDTEALPLLPKLIYDASRGEMGMIGRIYGSLLALGSISSRGMMFSVQCNEEISFSSLEQYHNELVDYPDLAPYLRDSILGEFGYNTCTFWNAGQADLQENEPVMSDIPALIMQGEFDPITPPAWGQQAAETLSNSYFYLYPGVGHGAVAAACARDMMITFIQDPHQAPDDACIAGMKGLTFIIPAPEPETVELKPFTSLEKGVQGLVPAGWSEAAPGVYARLSTSIDQTSLSMDVLPMTAGALLEKLAGQMGFNPALEPVDRISSDRFEWGLYHFKVQGLTCDLALAEDEGLSYMVLLVSESGEQEQNYGSIFLPVLESITPLE